MSYDSVLLVCGLNFMKRSNVVLNTMCHSKLARCVRASVYTAVTCFMSMAPTALFLLFTAWWIAAMAPQRHGRDHTTF